VGAKGVVGARPALDEDLGLLERRDDLAVEQLVAELTSVTPIDRSASATVRPCAVSTSTCRSFATISSAVCRFLDIDPSSTGPKAIPQEGPLLRGQTIDRRQGERDGAVLAKRRNAVEAEVERNRIAGESDVDGHTGQLLGLAVNGHRGLEAGALGLAGLPGAKGRGNGGRLNTGPLGKTSASGCSGSSARECRCKPLQAAHGILQLVQRDGLCPCLDCALAIVELIADDPLQLSGDLGLGHGRSSRRQVVGEDASLTRDGERLVKRAGVGRATTMVLIRHDPLEQAITLLLRAAETGTRADRKAVTEQVALVLRLKVLT
jgi:hypothetical protein